MAQAEFMKKPLPHSSPDGIDHGSAIEVRQVKKFAVSVIESPTLDLTPGGEKQHMLVTDREFKKGELLYAFTAPIQSVGDKFSFQVSPDQHVMPDENGHYTNHSCEATGYVDHEYAEEKEMRTATVKVYARKNLAAGEQVTLDYDAMEERLYEPLVCQCGSARCRGHITGWDGLNPAKQEAFIQEGIVPPYLAKKYADEQEAKIKN